MLQNMQKINNMAKERIKTDLFIKSRSLLNFFNYGFVNSISENVKKKNAIRKNIDIIWENQYTKHKGKPVERQGRKAMGLRS